MTSRAHGWTVAAAVARGTSLVTVALLGMVTVATAHLSDGGDPGLIHACVANNGGIRIVAPDGVCRGSETARHWGKGLRAARDPIVRAIPFGTPLTSINIDDVPNLSSIIGVDADLATIASRNVILQGSAIVLDTGVVTRVLLVWIGDPSVIDGKLTWPVKLFLSGSEMEYTRPDLASTELVNLVIVSIAAE